MTLKQFENSIDKSLIESLGSLNYVSKAIHLFQRDFSINKYGIIIIEKTDRRTKNTLFLNPIIGFVHSDVERLGKLLAREFYTPGYIPNTVSDSLGYLTPKKEYLTWNFKIGEREKTTKNTIDNLVNTISKYAVSKMEEFCDDGELFRAMIEHETSVDITNRVKAPILLFLMGKRQEALYLAKKLMLEIRPKPKVISSQEPHFATVEEAFEFFKMDQDPRYYYNYLQFYKRFEEYFKTHN